MLEVRPLGVRCNIQCQYCYQNPQRDAGNYTQKYSVERMKSTILAEDSPFALFGGEPLLVPERDLEDLWSFGFDRFGQNAIQTNGTLITDEHIRMFKQYRVGVGISIDGPGELNDVRWQGTLEKTREATARSEQAIRQLCREGIVPSLIITLHRGNATAAKLPALLAWVCELEKIGVRSVRLHLLESENAQIRATFGLSTEENIAALLAFLRLQKSLSSLKFDLFSDMRRLLAGSEHSTSCIWNACDPYTTAAVRGVEGHGQLSNCGRTNKDGIEFGKAQAPGFERYIALYLTPQEAGGCSGCRFFLMCKGQCPGTALEGDWRNRTEHCEVWKAVYAQLETEFVARGQKPLSLSADRESIEKQLLDQWSRGQPGLVRRPRRKRTGSPPAARGDAAWFAALRRLSHLVEKSIGA
jgi:uncharacterized protein